MCPLAQFALERRVSQREDFHARRERDAADAWLDARPAL